MLDINTNESYIPAESLSPHPHAAGERTKVSASP
jgi:hypothetical protein